jgi:hypothetical protein
MATGPGGGGNVPETAGSIKAYFSGLLCSVFFVQPSLFSLLGPAAT